MNWLLIITFLLAPAYTLRFSLFGLPLNFLMLWIGILWLAMLIYLPAKKQVRAFFSSIKRTDKALLAASSLFFLAGTISLLAKGLDQKKLGEWLVLFVQPISLFFIVRYFAKSDETLKRKIIIAAYFSLGAAGALAVAQYFTLWTLPPAWWGNSVEPKRAVAFFVHPNFYALWCAPLLAFLIPDMFQQFSIFNFQFSKSWKPALWLIGAIGLLLSLSRAGWLGLAAAVVVYLIVAADKKIRQSTMAAIVAIVIIVAVVPNFRYRFILPFLGEKSSVSRLSLWHTGWKGIKESPVTGLGLTGFSNQWKTLNTDPNLDTHNFPHNIFLDLWVETGLLGLLSMVTIFAWAIINGLKKRHDLVSLGVALFVIALIVQGQIDNPYFKNDLALVFWVVLALIS